MMLMSKSNELKQVKSMKSWKNKKINSMKRIISILILSSFVLTGCVVSKKKYEAMVGERDFLENRLTETREENRQLEAELESALADFETMKQELHQSDALKSDKVSDLFAQTEQLGEKVTTLKKDLADAHSKFRSQQSTSKERANQLETLISQIAQLKNDTSGLQYSLQMSKDRQTNVQQELREVKEKYNNLAAGNTQLKSDLKTSERKMAMHEGQLVEKTQSLSNVSEAFIELRKELLTAKSTGTAIDPNNNKIIDKIARLLGHY
jgi:chromosome segregation ATPase